jgi:hypothetical protein
MKRLLLTLFLILGWSVCANAQGILYQLNPPAPNARVFVCPSPDNGYPCPTTANIFSDVGLTQAIAQPVSLGSGGFFSFYIASGTYVLQLTGPGYNSGNRQVVTIGGGGTTLTGHTISVPLQCPAASGSGTAYTCSTSPTFVPADGDAILFEADVANTGAATLNVNSSSAAPIKKQGGGTALLANDFLVGQDNFLIFDGTNWQMQGQTGNAVSSFPVTTPVAVNSGGTITVNTGGSIAVAGSGTVSATSVPFSGVASGTTTNALVAGPGGSFNFQPGSVFGVAGSNLQNFIGGYTGVSPKDCSTASCNTPGVGAKGDWHAFFDCTISAGAAIENCTGSHFTSTAVDGGKAAELECNNAIIVTTISTVQSATQATLATTCSVTQTNTYFAFGTDDNVALRNWATFIGASFSSTSQTASVRAGYLPRGIYYTSKAVRFIGPGPAIPTLQTNTGECSKIAGGTIWCPVVLTGDGTWASQIVGSSNFAWNADGTSTNTGLCYFNNWSGSYINNMGCGWAAQQESGFTTNTTGQTGLVGTWVFDNNQHTKWDSNFASGCHSAGVPLCAGLVIDKDFESSYSNSALEFNDIQLLINASGGANGYEKVVFDTLFCEGGGGANGNIQINGGSYKQVTFRNVHSRDGSASVNIRTGVATTLGDALVFERFRQTTSGAGANQGFVVQSGIKVECDDCYLEDTSASATAVLVTVTASPATVHFNGGGMSGASLTNCMNLGSTSVTYAVDMVISGCTNNFTGAGVFNAMLSTPIGWGGPGGISGSFFLGSLSNTTAVTATNPSAATILQEVALPVGLLNTLNQSALFHANGIFTTAAVQTPTLTFVLQLCTGAGGTGTCVAQATWVTNASTASSTNNNWAIDAPISTASIGAAGTLIVGGYVSADLGATTVIPDTIQGNANTGASAATNLTVPLFMSLTVAMSSANAGNSVKSLAMTIK